MTTHRTPSRRALVTLAAVAMLAAAQLPGQSPAEASPATPAVAAAPAPVRSGGSTDYGPTIATALVQIAALFSQRDRMRRLAAKLRTLEEKVSALADTVGGCELHRARPTPAASTIAQGAA